MIQLRWVKKKVPYMQEVSPGCYGGPVEEKIKVVNILQYRWLNEPRDLVIGGPGPTWSNWIDVPEVEE